VVEVVLHGGLAASRDEDEVLDPGRPRLVQHVVDQRAGRRPSASPWGWSWWRAARGCPGRRRERRLCERASSGVLLARPSPSGPSGRGKAGASTPAGGGGMRGRARTVGVAHSRTFVSPDQQAQRCCGGLDRLADWSARVRVTQGRARCGPAAPRRASRVLD
jgi:hypothetical protein